jgi:hypothetical protein
MLRSLHLRTRLVQAAVAALVAIPTLLLLILYIAGTEYWRETVLGFRLHIAAIACVAGMTRFCFKSTSLRASAACGVIIAVLGYSIVVFLALSSI